MADDPDFRFNETGLDRALQLLGGYLQRTQERAATPRPGGLGVPDALPIEGVGAEQALETLADAVLNGAAALGSAGFVAHMDPPTPWMTWAAVQWAAALNQNLLHPDTAPIARDVERGVIRWLAPYFGMDGGHLVPGSTIANITALWAARELRGVTQVVCSSAAHLSVGKAANLLGLPVRVVPCDPDQTLRVAELGDLRRAALVLTAGTVASGAVDALDAGKDAAWRHIDAAWAGPLRLSAAHAHILDRLEGADSVSVSAHKWLFQPKECAMVLFADSEAAHRSISYGGSGYLAVPNVGMLGSHGASALPLLVTLSAWGERGVAARIDRCMTIAAELAARVADDDRLELFRPPTTGVVLWRPRGRSLERVRGELRRSFVSIAEVNGERWFRSVAANPLADPHLLVDETLRLL